jgi:hypothetical protein
LAHVGDTNPITGGRSPGGAGGVNTIAAVTGAGGGSVPGGAVGGAAVGCDGGVGSGLGGGSVDGGVDGATVVVVVDAVLVGSGDVGSVGRVVVVTDGGGVTVGRVGVDVVVAISSGAAPATAVDVTIPPPTAKRRANGTSRASRRVDICPR